MKGQKGITLVALVITIIVMLILVAVTITIAFNNGLFDKARTGAGQTNNAVKAEQNLADGSVTVKKNVSGNLTNTPTTIDDVVNGTY